MNETNTLESYSESLRERLSIPLGRFATHATDNTIAWVRTYAEYKLMSYGLPPRISAVPELINFLRIKITPGDQKRVGLVINEIHPVVSETSLVPDQFSSNDTDDHTLELI